MTTRRDVLHGAFALPFVTFFSRFVVVEVVTPSSYTLTQLATLAGRCMSRL